MRGNILSIASLGFILMIFQSCMLQTGTIRFERKPNEMISSQKFKDYFKEHPHPSILLKVPHLADSIKDDFDNNPLYHSIEKELLNNGMVLKDRSIYEDMVYHSRAVDIKELKNELGVDLILEVIEIKRDIVYSSHTIYDQYGYKRNFNDYSVVRYGASITFKIIFLEDFEMVGSYTFNYTPCKQKNVKHDCHCSVGYKGILNKMYPKINMCGDREDPQFNEIEIHLLNDFIAESIHEMLEDLKNN